MYVLFTMSQMRKFSSMSIGIALRKVDEEGIKTIAKDMSIYGFDHSKQGDMVVTMSSIYKDSFELVSPEEIAKYKVWNIHEGTNLNGIARLREADEHVLEKVNFVDGRHRLLSTTEAFNGSHIDTDSSMFRCKVIFDLSTLGARVLSFNSSRWSASVAPCFVDELVIVFSLDPNTFTPLDKSGKQVDDGELLRRGALIKIGRNEINILKILKDSLSPEIIRFVVQNRNSCLLSLRELSLKKNEPFLKFLEKLKWHKAVPSRGRGRPISLLKLLLQGPLHINSCIEMIQRTLFGMVIFVYRSINEEQNQRLVVAEPIPGPVAARFATKLHEYLPWATDFTKASDRDISDGMMVLFTTCAWDSYLRNTTVESFHASEDSFMKFESMVKAVEPTKAIPSFQDAEKCFQDIMEMQEEEKVNDVANSEDVRSFAANPGAEYTQTRVVAQRRSLIPTEPPSSREATKGEKNHSTGNQPGENDDRVIHTETALDKHENRSSACLDLITKTKITADANPKEDADGKHPQQTLDVGEVLDISVTPGPIVVDLTSPDPEKNDGKDMEQESDIVDDPMESPELAPVIEINTADPEHNQKNDSIDLQKDVEGLDEVNPMESPELAPVVEINTAGPEHIQKDDAIDLQRDVEGLDKVRVISEPLPTVDLITPDPEPKEKDDGKYAQEEVDAEGGLIEVMVRTPDTVPLQKGATGDAGGPPASKDKAVPVPDMQMKDMPKTKSSTIGVPNIRRSARIQLKSSTRSPRPRDYLRRSTTATPINKKRGSEKRGSENERMPPRKKQCIRKSFVPSCAAARLEEATELIESILLCNVVKRSGSLLQNLPDSVSTDEWIVFLSSEESPVFINELFVSLHDKGYNVTHIVLFNSKGCAEMPSTLGISSLPLVRQVLFMPESWSSPFTIPANVQCQIGHYYVPTCSEKCVPLKCLRECQLGDYFKDIVEKLPDGFSILDTLENETSVVKAFLAEKTRLSYIRAIEISYHPVQGSTTLPFFRVLREYVLRNCDCGGHLLLSEDLEERLNEHSDKGKLDAGATEPFHLSVNGKDRFEDYKPIQHYSLYLNSQKMTWDCSRTHDDVGEKLESGAFLPEGQFKQALKDKRSLVPLVYGRSAMVDEESGMRDFVGRLSPFEMRDMFVAGIFEKMYWFFFDDKSMASKFNQHQHHNVVLYNSEACYKFLRPLYEHGIQSGADLQMVVPKLDISALRNIYERHPEHILQCKKCKAVEIFCHYGSGYNFDDDALLITKKG